MRAHFGLPSVSSEDVGGALSTKAPISVNFEIPYFTVSGIQVRYLKIIEKSGYQALPWVRYITQNGDYQVNYTHNTTGQLWKQHRGRRGHNEGKRGKEGGTPCFPCAGTPLPILTACMLVSFAPFRYE
jgi:hypothetical protein